MLSIPIRNEYVYSTNLLPKVVKPNGELFENLYMQLVDILKNFVQTEFDLLLFQSEVGSRLSLMENLIALAQRQVRPPSPTPSPRPRSLFNRATPSPLGCTRESHSAGLRTPRIQRR